MGKLLDGRSLRAKTLQLQGYSQSEIGELMQCSTRSVSRYLHHDLEEEPGERLATIDPDYRERALAVGNPLLLGLLEDLEAMRIRGELKPRDAIIAFGVVFDKLSRLAIVKESAEPTGEEKAREFADALNRAIKADNRETEEVITDAEVIEEGNFEDKG